MIASEHRPWTSISPPVAKQIAIDANVTSVPIVASHLLHCNGRADAMKSLEELRRNRPELFKTTRRTKYGM